MVETTLRRAVSNAEMVRYADDQPVFVVWSGGTTFNVYTTGPGGETPINEVDVFMVSDHKGRPVDRDTAEEHISDYLERIQRPA